MQSGKFKSVNNKVDFVRIEHDILEKWVNKELILTMELFNFIVNFLDYKIELYYKGFGLKNIMIRWAISIYRYIARFRFKHFIAFMPFELLIKKLVFLENRAIRNTVSEKGNL